jgi:hypothetical protein
MLRSNEHFNIQIFDKFLNSSDYSRLAMRLADNQLNLWNEVVLVLEVSAEFEKLIKVNITIVVDITFVEHVKEETLAIMTQNVIDGKLHFHKSPSEVHGPFFAVY